MYWVYFTGCLFTAVYLIEPWRKTNPSFAGLFACTLVSLAWPILWPLAWWKSR